MVIGYLFNLAGYPAFFQYTVSGKSNPVSGPIPDIKKGRISGASLTFTSNVKELTKLCMKKLLFNHLNVAYKNEKL
jgi:hypothetical protein